MVTSFSPALTLTLVEEYEDEESMVLFPASSTAGTSLERVWKSEEVGKRGMVNGIVKTAS